MIAFYYSQHNTTLHQPRKALFNASNKYKHTLKCTSKKKRVLIQTHTHTHYISLSLSFSLLLFDCYKRPTIMYVRTYLVSTTECN